MAAAPGGVEAPLTATQYAEGHLDWHSVDLDLEVSLGATADPAGRTLVQALMPAPVSFRGAPCARFWELEDAAIDYGLLPAGPGELPQLMLSEFATDFGNDWYVIPIELDVGTLTRTRSLVIIDGFGVQTLIAPVNTAANAATGWSMFELATLDRSGGLRLRPAPNLSFLAPSLLRSIDSRPVEEVRFLRDEMANLAWAVEHAVQGRLEQGREPASARRTQASPAPPEGLPRYRLASELPGNWTPLLPQRGPDGSLRLVRAAVLATDGTNEMRRPEGELLSAAPHLALYDEEIPRAGVRVTRQFEASRWIGGGRMLWMGLRKQTGKGEGSSALRFDTLDMPTSGD